jgi:hypothetical protein
MKLVWCEVHDSPKHFGADICHWGWATMVDGKRTGFGCSYVDATLALAADESAHQ